MTTREEIRVLIAYVLGRRSREVLEREGLDAVPKEARIAALRGLQDLGWINHSGTADVEESYSLTKDGRRMAAERPAIASWDSQMREHVDALQLLDVHDSRARLEALRKIISIEFNLGNWDSALSYCYDLKSVAEKSGYIADEAYALLYRGHIERAQNHWDEALESYLSAQEKYTETGDRAGVCATDRALGIIYGSKGDHASATRCFEASLSLAGELGDSDAMLRAEANLAIIYDLEGRFEESERASKNCLEHALKANDSANAMRIANNLGVLNMSREKFNEAIEFFEKAIVWSRAVQSRGVLGAALVNAGYCHSKTGRTSLAVPYTDEAVSIFKDPYDLNMLALAYRNYGCIEFRNGNLDLGFDWFEKSVRAGKASGVKDTVAACCCEYGMALIESAANMHLAKSLLKKSSSLYRELGNMQRARAVESRLAAC